ncbi:MAG: DsrE/DsrF/DrsH-like family protein [Planctomycetales bacterium]|nr:DsrE/DsrF/DrsH-like family protein [Planctomycetales bacterium]
MTPPTLSPMLEGSTGDASDPSTADAATWMEMESRVDRLEQLIKKQPDQNRLNLLVFDSSRDKLLAALVMANGAAACGMEVTIFCSFWATAALRKGGQVGRKSLIEWAFGWMLPANLNSTKLSRMEMGGVGRLLMKREMKKKQIADLDQLIATAADLGVTIRVCEMSMQLMGIQREELIDYPGIGFCGVASFMEDASMANTTLFI